MTLQNQDRRLLALVDAAVERGTTAGGVHLTCHRGCSPCCFGPFAITQLDAWRLRQGLAELADTDPPRAAAISERAEAAVSEQARCFPPNQTGVFRSAAEEERLYRVFEAAPCPALDPDTGACAMYPWRPIACRTHGPPVRIRGEDFPPCPLGYQTATTEEVEDSRVTLDIDAAEDPLVEAASTADGGQRGMTTVAFAIGSPTSFSLAPATQP